MGKALAKRVVSRGGRVLIASRDKERLNAARTEIISGTGALDVHSVETYCLDATDEASVADFAEHLEAGLWDGLVISAATKAPHGAISSLPSADTRGLMESKLWSAYYCCKHVAPKLADGGAIALVSGVLNRRPGLNCVPLAMTNGALEGLTRSLALELGPRLRVNCVASHAPCSQPAPPGALTRPLPPASSLMVFQRQCGHARTPHTCLLSACCRLGRRPIPSLVAGLSPGFCDTERFDHMEPKKKEAMLENTAASLPLQRVGQPSDMSEALDFLLCSAFTTGVRDEAALEPRATAALVHVHVLVLTHVML